MKMRKLGQDNWTIKNLTNTDIGAILLGAELVLENRASNKGIFESCESLKQQFDSTPKKVAATELSTWLNYYQWRKYNG